MTRHDEAPDKDQFAALMRDAISRAGETGALTYDADEFRLLTGGEERNILNLGNAYGEYCAAGPEKRPEILRRFVRNWFVTRRGVPDQYEDVVPDLLPGVRSRAYYELARLRFRLDGMNPPEWPYRVLAGRLGVGLVYDLPESMLQVQQPQLATWGVGFDDALQTAIDNLEGISRHEWRGPVPGVWASPWHDNYDASRLVLTERIRGLDVAGDPVALAPNRDALLVTGSDDAEGLTKLAELAEAALKQPRPISGSALVLDGATWLPFLPAPEHPAHHRFKWLWLQTIGQEYGDQRELLNALHGKTGEDVWVANFSARRHEETGRVTTFCVWSEGVDTLLPCTDEVVFFRSTGKDTGEVVAKVPWRQVERIAGRLLAAQGWYPERYRVTAFPGAEELAALRAENK